MSSWYARGVNKHAAGRPPACARRCARAWQVKLWTAASGACYVTLAEHRAPVTGVAFLPSASALVSASLDGTLRAWDLVRYRCFRTMTTPAPVQFASLAVDPAGEARARPRAPPCH
jgi:WD40 repeat protein